MGLWVLDSHLKGTTHQNDLSLEGVIQYRDFPHGISEDSKCPNSELSGATGIYLRAENAII